MRCAMATATSLRWYLPSPWNTSAVPTKPVVTWFWCAAMSTTIRFTVDFFLQLNPHARHHPGSSASGSPGEGEPERDPSAYPESADDRDHPLAPQPGKQRAHCLSGDGRGSLDVERGRPVSVELELCRPSYSNCTLHLGKTFTES